MTWSVAPGSRPSFHTDPVQWLLRATAASAASAAGAGVSTGATAAIDASASGASAAAITGALQCPAWGPLYEGWVRGDG